MKSARQLLIVLAFGMATMAQDARAPESTAGLANGRFWLGIDLARRLHYLIGMHDASLYFVSDPQMRASFIPKNATYAEIEQFLTQFYSDPTNRLIPVLNAVAVFVAKQRGETATELEDLIVRFRQISQPKEAPPPKQ